MRRGKRRQGDRAFAGAAEGRRRARAAPPRLAAAASTILFVLAALAQPAAAARNAEVAIMDDQLLLGQPQAQIDESMRVFRGLGIDRVRVSAFWRDHAPAAQSPSKPEGFAAHDPAAAGYRWESLDRVVASAGAHGLKVLISITTPGPLWASAQPARLNPVWKPKPVEFGRFAQAVATRYAAFVDMYALMNEPNQGAWIQPQSDRRGLYSPHLYRRMVNASYSRVKAADPSARVLIGELASSGRNDRGTTRPIRPLLFLRAMGCRDSRYRRLGTRRCRDFRPAEGDMLGHHPYRFASSPSRRSRRRDDAAMGDWRRLLRTLDALTRRDAIVPGEGRRLDVYYTEFGYQTDPPDPYSGVPLRAQDSYLQHAAFLSWRTPRVRGWTQFRLTDGALVEGSTDRERYGEFQSGLLFRDWRPKRSFYNFADPIWIEPRRARRGRRALLWGQVRPGRRRSVTVEYRSRSGRKWRRLKRVRTDRRGYWRLRVASRKGQYRFRWKGGRSSVRRVR